MFKIVIQDVDTGLIYKQEREKECGSCEGCAFDNDADRCSSTPMTCGELGLIWVDVESH